MLDILSSLECLTFAGPLPLPEGLAVVPPGGGGLQQQEEGGGGQCGEQHGDQGPGDHCLPTLADTRYLISQWRNVCPSQTHPARYLHSLSTVSVDT